LTQFAAGSQNDGQFDSAFLLATGDDDSGQWVVISTDETTCANKDTPAEVLAVSPCKVNSSQLFKLIQQI